jgi:hypothetical protein
VPEGGEKRKGERKEERREEKKEGFHSEDSIVNCVPKSETSTNNKDDILWCPTH